MLHTVHLQAMRLQAAPLRKALLAQVALVRPHSCVGPRVALQVERVVESLSAERAQVPLDVRMTLHVPVQQALQVERLGADAAHKLVRVVLGHGRRSRRFRLLLVATHPVALRVLDGQRVLDPMAAVDKLQLHFGR